MWKKFLSLPWIAKLVIVLVAISLFNAFLKPIKNLFALLGFRIFENNQNTEIGNDNSGLPGGGVNSANRTQVCLDVANRIQVEIHDYKKRFLWWVPTALFEDEKEIIKQLNRLQNATEARLVSLNYKNICNEMTYTKSLKQDILSYVLDNSDNNGKIKSIVINNLY